VLQIVYKGFWMEPWLSGLGPEGQAAVMTKTMDALAAGAMTPDVGARPFALTSTGLPALPRREWLAAPASVFMP
jgi:hypothetical protein